MNRDWLIYGAYGYTGKLIATEAVKRGMKPVLAGRRERPLRELAERLELPWRVLRLDGKRELREALEEAGLVLHCAGPFSRTGPPMMQACLEARCAYLDITGEIEVFRHAQTLDRAAREAGVSLLPGTGFDVVPTDCLAVSLQRALPDAVDLVLAFEAHGGPSPGTARTSIESLAKGGRIRRDGRLVRVPLGWDVREFQFNNRRRKAVTIPWGDVFTAFVSTGIPSIRVYMSVSESVIKRLRRLRWLRPLLRMGVVQRWVQARAGGAVSGPDEGRRARTYCYVLGEACDAQGNCVSGRMVTPNGYTLTCSAALGIVEHALENGLPAGFHTPAQVMGAEYAMSLPGVEFKLDVD